jgi:hypothetical protein
VTVSQAGLPTDTPGCITSVEARLHVGELLLMTQRALGHASHLAGRPSYAVNALAAVRRNFRLLVPWLAALRSALQTLELGATNRQRAKTRALSSFFTGYGLCLGSGILPLGDVTPPAWLLAKLPIRETRAPPD